ncbi:hypothetical protein Tco_0296385 [Tanacetum coccineum]
MFNGGVEMSRDAIVVHEMFNRRVEIRGVHGPRTGPKPQEARTENKENVEPRTILSSSVRFRDGFGSGTRIIGPSTPPSDSPGPSRNAECSNCKLLFGKIKVLEATMETFMHPEQNTLNLTALLHEVYNDMGKLDLE